MLQNFCEATSCNGIIDLYEARHNKFRFTFWLIILLLMIGASVYFTYKNIVSYMESPTMTVVTVVRQDTLAMPDVQICYNGGYNAAEMLKRGMADDLIYSAQFRSSDMYDPDLLDPNFGREEFEAFLVKNQMNHVDFVKNFSYSCEDVVLGIFCNAEDKVRMEQNDCSDAKMVLTTKGRCFTFTNNGKQMFPGTGYGMILSLVGPVGSFAQMFPISAIDYMLFDHFTVALESKMGVFISKRAYTIPRSTKVDMTLSAKRYRRTGANNPCNKDEQSTVSARQAKCFDGLIKIFCNCTVVTDEVGSNLCSPFANCSSTTKLGHQTNDCIKTCLPDCDELIYEVTITQTPFPNDVLNRSISGVFIGFNAMQYTDIAEVDSFTLDIAIANVGGQSGLWLGISVVSVVQAIYYFVWAMIKKSFNGKLRQIHVKTKRNVIMAYQ